jgi:hypothetical protein
MLLVWFEQLRHRKQLAMAASAVGMAASGDD